MHAHEVHTHEMHAREVHAHETHAYEIHTLEMHARKVWGETSRSPTLQTVVRLADLSRSELQNKRSLSAAVAAAYSVCNDCKSRPEWIVIWSLL